MERANKGRRRKVEMRKIENKSSRQVTFSKRRKGLLKKAQELSVLCDAEVAAVIFSATGKLYQSCTAQSLPEMLEKYRHCVGSSDFNQNPREEKNSPSRFASIQKCAELLQILDRNLEESHIDNLSVIELVQLEKQLDDALTETTSRKTQMLLQSISALRGKENMLQEEKEMLQKEIVAVLEDGRALEEMNSNKNELGNHSGSPQQQPPGTLNLLCQWENSKLPL